MNLRELEVFRAIMLGGTITEAARILHVSQPAVSIALRHSEDQLGMPLFRREKGRVYPTREALELYSEVEGLFEKLDAVQKFASDLRDTRSGLVSIASTPTLTYAFLAKAMTRFRRERPGVRILLEVTHTQRTVELAAAGQIDLGFIHAPSENPILQTEKLATAEIICVLPRDHPLADRTTLGPNEIKDFPLITNIRNSISPRIEEAFRKGGIERDFAIACNHTMTVNMLVEAGAGIGLVDPWIEKTRFPSLVRKPFHPRVEISPRALYSRSQSLSRLAERFLEVVREEVAKTENCSPAA
ncbi:MAG: LysR family transcriptional regulator [Rhodospirillales bacterium]|jgi:DNA-binding transcriptional LysR family regulator|nr:LysR family transcriptional regulator [Rhodospirillales bacterium]